MSTTSAGTLPISIQSTVIFEGDLYPGQTYSQTVPFTNNHIDPIWLLKGRPSDPDVRITRLPVGWIMPGESSEIEVSYTPASSAVRGLEAAIVFDVKIRTLIEI